MIYTCVGFVLEEKFFVIRKLLEPRKLTSFPVHLVINLPKSARQIKSPYLVSQRQERIIPMELSSLSDLSSVLRSNPVRVYLVQLSVDFITNC